MSYIPGKETRQVKSYLRYRAALTALSTQIKNKIHALLDQHVFLEKETLAQLSDIFGKQGLELLTKVVLPGDDTEILKSWLGILEHLHKEILRANQWTRQHIKEDFICRILKSIPGIGDTFAILIRYEIDEIHR